MSSGHLATYRVTARVVTADDLEATMRRPELAALSGRVTARSHDATRLSFDVRALTAIDAERQVTDALRRTLAGRIELEMSVPL